MQSEIELKVNAELYLHLAGLYMILYEQEKKDTNLSSRTPGQGNLLECALDAYARAIVYSKINKENQPLINRFTELYLKLHENNMIGLERYLDTIILKPMCKPDFLSNTENQKP
jgi:hypothetical protein